MMVVGRKRVRCSTGEKIERRFETFERLPDDLVICILSELSYSSSCPADFFNAMLVCKRFKGLGANKSVLSRAGSNLFSIRAKNWSESAHRFLMRCVISGSVEACYFLGMVRFYCLQNRASGASLMAKAAIRSHAQALYSLAVIQFNGSGGSRNDKDLRAGIALCARAAYLGHVDALREIGHCLQDGYGINRNIPEGRRLLFQADARELSLAICSSNSSTTTSTTTTSSMKLNIGCSSPDPKPHPANQFMVGWFDLRGEELGSDMKVCSYFRCGRPQTRPHEFRRCSICGVVNYCSRGCQARDWKLRHKVECVPAEGVMDFGLGLGGLDVGQGNNNEQVMS